MKKYNPTQLPFTKNEKESLIKHKIKIGNLFDYAPDEWELLLNITSERARELQALAEFQTIPSIGIQFAKDLVFMGFYSINELKEKNPALLTDAYEQKKGYWMDPCVEDQFRLAVYVANTHDDTKKWWNFTSERKQYRLENGYPKNRPSLSWYESNKRKS